MIANPAISAVKASRSLVDLRGCGRLDPGDATQRRMLRKVKVPSAWRWTQTAQAILRSAHAQGSFQDARSHPGLEAARHSVGDSATKCRPSSIRPPCSVPNGTTPIHCSLPASNARTYGLLWQPFPRSRTPSRQRLVPRRPTIQSATRGHPSLER